MSDNNNNIYSKAIPFTIIAAVVVLIGSIVTVGLPLMMADMQPKMDTVRAYTALELEGRNIYQREGCFNCHSQVVRPLTADVVRYGEYTKAGESYYEHPFLWGSKRTGPDLARQGGKYSDEWQIAHLINPQQFFPQSNMPKYPFLDRPADAVEAEASMKVLGFPYTAEDIELVKKSTELEALTAYMQYLGTGVADSLYVKVNPSKYETSTSPVTRASDRVKLLYSENCASCHGTTGQGTDFGAPMADNAPASVADGQLFVAIANGIAGVMPSHIGFMTEKDIWGLVVYVKELGQAKQGAEAPAMK